MQRWTEYEQSSLLENSIRHVKDIVTNHFKLPISVLFSLVEVSVILLRANSL